MDVAIGLGVYLGAVVLGLILSFTLRQEGPRSFIRWLTATLAIPIVLVIGGLLLLMLAFYLAQPLSLAKLQRDFPSKKAT